MGAYNPVKRNTCLDILPTKAKPCGKFVSSGRLKDIPKNSFEHPVAHHRIAASSGIETKRFAFLAFLVSAAMPVTIFAQK